jgi:hypothetical protein
MTLFRQLGITLSLALVLYATAHAAKVLRLENRYDLDNRYNIWKGSFDLLAEGKFYWPERPTLDAGLTLKSLDAVTGASVDPDFQTVLGARQPPFILGDYILSDAGSWYGMETWSLYDRRTGNRLATRNLVDHVHSAFIRGDRIILVQNIRGGGYLSTFTLPDMKFVSEVHPPALAGAIYPTMFGDKIVGLRWATSCADFDRCPIDLISLSLDGEEISRIELTAGNPPDCGGVYRIRDIDFPRVVVGLGCSRYAIADLEQHRLLAMHQLFRGSGSWVTITGNLLFVRPETGPVDVVKATAREIWIFDLESGRELARTDLLAPGQIKALGNKLLLRPYNTTELLVYSIDETALPR